ncbi:uroporphyrinogen decarboxylase [Promicromonospora umidemergens]|uniref:Uroporphyrinogen decarboxylase n=1 Tax=Promicromonospora umidemergens TaxID=629679 RepID=A0ABP8Y3B1_9MICO|nr:uroporphyrinogen decarboxylase [Promicromonospora umidemergens]
MLQLYAPRPGKAESGSVKSTTIAPTHPLADGRTSAAPLVRALRGDRPGRTPVWFMRQAGRSLPEYRQVRQGTDMLEACLRPELASEITLQPVRRHGVDAAVFFSDIVVPLKLAGVGVDIAPGVGPVMDQPYRTADDVAGLVSRTLDPAALDPIREAVALTVAELGPTPLLGFGGAPFTLAAYLVEGRPSRDHLAARTLMHADPETWDALVTWTADLTGAFLRAQVEAGASAVQLFDSWAGSLSLADYTSRVAPASTRALGHVADTGVPGIHFGTGTEHLLPAMRSVLVSAGITDHAVGVDYRTPLDEAAALLPGVPLQGNIDPALLGAPWDVLEAHVRDVVARGRKANGHVVNLGHGVPPDTDPTVLTRVVELVHSL